jgi:hypothetical protein
MKFIFPIFISILASLVISCSIRHRVDYFDSDGYRFRGTEVNNKYHGSFTIYNEYGVPIVKIKYNNGQIMYVKCSSPKAGTVITYDAQVYNNMVFVERNESNRWFKVETIEQCYDLQD